MTFHHSSWPQQGLPELLSAFWRVTKTQIQKDTGHRLGPNLDQLFSGKAPLAFDTK